MADLVSSGLTNRAVARRLNVSTSTVGTHLRSVFNKLDVQSRIQLTNAVRQAARRAVTADGQTWVATRTTPQSENQP